MGRSRRGQGREGLTEEGTEQESGAEAVRGSPPGPGRLTGPEGMWRALGLSPGMLGSQGFLISLPAVRLTGGLWPGP